MGDWAKQRSWVPYGVLLLGVMAAASASIMIRLAQQMGVPSLTIAAGRMGFAALILLPIGLLRARAEVLALPRRDLLLAAVSGVLLAMHFAAWISSLAYTSVASSVALVATNPLWVALITVLVFRERLALPTWVGVGLTLVGTVLIALSDSGGGAGSNALLGDALALLGALAGSGYFLIGRELRKRLSTLAYIWLVYTAAAIVLLAMAVLSGGGAADAGGFAAIPPLAYLLFLGLAVGPQLLGHTSFNWALRYLSATFVAVAILGEPIGSALLAWLFFGEQFAPLQLLGFVVLLVGILAAARTERAVPEPETAEYVEAAAS